MKKSLILFALVFVIFGTSVAASDNELELDYNETTKEYEYELITPEDSVSATNVIAEAVRLHGLYSDSEIEESYSRQDYLSYATENGIIYNGLFDNYSRGATRAEAVFVLYNAIPKELVEEKINSIVSIPDCDPSAGYYRPLKEFYEAGIITGYDEYGAFRPGAYITNAEFSEILTRLSHPEKRVFREFTEYSTDAHYYLIDDFHMTTTVRDIQNIGSGWRYDYTGSLLAGELNVYKNELVDNNTTDSISIRREIFPEKDGVLVFETLLNYSGNHDGFAISFDDNKHNSIFTFGTANNKIYGENTSGDRTYYNAKLTSFADGSLIRVRIQLDLDNNTATAHVGGTKVGDYNLTEGYNPISFVSVSTGKAQVSTVKVCQAHLYKNYTVNDTMRVENIGKTPFGYDVTGNITIRKLAGSNNYGTGDVNSAKIVATANINSNAHKDFAELDGKVMLETYMLLPAENDGAYFRAGYKDYTVFNIESKNGKFYCGERELYDFGKNIWQWIRVEADTASQTFLIKINGKVVAENVPFQTKVPFFDNLDIGITPDSNCEMWFDDVEVYKLFEHQDYVPVPKKLETDYYISMSVCNLWRNGSHYGWDYIIPHDDLTPYLGYYDEGNPEVMDWEIKFLAEHGVSFYNMCWYAPACPQNDPIKKPRMVDAFHDGYFNAKYSDMLDFTIMFENASFGTAEAYDSFVNNIWPFWKEWYLSDERYFTIDNKPFLVIYQYDRWVTMCYEEPIVDSMSAERKEEIRANAIIKARNLVKMMEQDMIDMGYDGLIITYTNRGDSDKVANDCVALEADGVFPYNWGSVNNTYSNHVASVEAAYKFSQNKKLDLLAVAGIGFNHIGWKLERWPLMSLEEFEDLLVWFRDDYMMRYANKYANDPDNLWKSKFIQFATWNEYGEGHYLFPSNVHGFGYLDVIADVFGKEKHDTSLDVIPTDAQKARVNHLFPGNRHFIRRGYNVEIDFIVPDVVNKKYDFTAENAYKNLNLSYTNFKTTPKRTWVDSTNGYALRGFTNGTDPILNMRLSEYIEAEDHEFIHLKLGSSVGQKSLQIFFTTTEMSGPAETHKFETQLLEGVNDYYIPTSSSQTWAGTIKGIRIDPGNIPGVTVDFYTLEFMSYSNELRKLEVFVDNSKANTAAIDTAREVTKQEIYFAPMEEDNFYRKLHIVYDWNLRKGTLRLETPNETVFEFTEGSNKVYINGKEDTLDRAFTVYDGCPVLPLIYLLEKSQNYKYIYDYTGKKLNIFHLDVSTVFADFTNSDAESGEKGSFYNVVNGEDRVKCVVDPEDSTNHVWFVDSPEGQSWNYFRANTKFEAGKTYTVDFDIKLGNLSNGVSLASPLSINVNARYANTSQLESGIKNLYDHPSSAANISKSNGWVHVNYTFTVADDYVSEVDGVPYTDTITLFINPVKLGTAYHGVDYYVDNFIMRTKVDPFVIYNGDAESDDTTGIIQTAKYSIETETLSNGTTNRYWFIECTNNTGEYWNYWNQETKFTPGVTYYYEVDIKVGNNAKGYPAKDVVVALNARYYDASRQYLESSQRNEHSINLGKFSTGDDWVTCRGSFTISRAHATYEVSKVIERISFYSNPAVGEGSGDLKKYGVDFCIDNFKIYVEKPAHFE